MSRKLNWLEQVKEDARRLTTARIEEQKTKLGLQAPVVVEDDEAPVEETPQEEPKAKKTTRKKKSSSKKGK